MALRLHPQSKCMRYVPYTHWVFLITSPQAEHNLPTCEVGRNFVEDAPVGMLSTGWKNAKRAAARVDESLGSR